ncbi:hypothetical protein J1N35_004240 [Gossypium stocksii]|uniref:Uncharacterized protein n=1 Tax=Gossypium stocksii TaxID=47602 RepID=A0A9D3WDQ7_9ROSI|nr:hypothetical protein J1N35_004240 [Gossypium stocksii]
MAQIPVVPISILFLYFIAFFQASSTTFEPAGLSMKLNLRDLLSPGNVTTSRRIRRLIQL